MKFMVPEQVAELLQVDCDTVIAWLKQKKLPGVKIGDVWRIEEERLQQFLTKEMDKQNGPSDLYEMYEEYDQPRKMNRRGRKPTGKYDGLKNFLKQETTKEQVKMRFSDVEEKMKDKLPKSAYKLRPWWANDFSHSQARAWLHAGWETRNVDLENHRVTFVRRT